MEDTQLETPPEKKRPAHLFKKGQSGNPAGGNKPKYIRDYVGNKIEIAELYRMNAGHVFFELMKVIAAKDTPATARISAIKEFNDRAFGKAATSIRVSSVNESNETIDTTVLSNEVIAQIMAAKKPTESK